jgi:hypothetical protein
MWFLNGPYDEVSSFNVKIRLGVAGFVSIILSARKWCVACGWLSLDKGVDVGIHRLIAPSPQKEAGELRWLQALIYYVISSSLFLLIYPPASLLHES